MDTRNIRLLGRISLERTREVIEDRIKEWALDWCVDGAERVVLEDVRTPVANDADLDWSALRPGIAIYTACCDEDIPIGTLLLGKENDTQLHNRRLLDQIAGYAFTGLAKVFGAEPVEEDSATEPDPWLFNTLSGSLIVDLSVGSEPLQLLLSPAVVETLVPREAPTQAVQLASAHELVGDLSVALEISLSLGQLTLDDLRSLKPGDCVATNVPLDTSFCVQLNKNTPIAHCRLGRVRDRRAVIIEEKNTGE